MTVSNILQAALEHHRSGRLQQAEALYRQILQAVPNHPDALHLLGVLAHQAGKSDIAAELISKAIKANSSSHMYYNSLGNAFKDLGKLEAAVNSYQKALALKADYAEARYNLGLAFQVQGKSDAAIENYKQALSLKPNYAEAHNNLGYVLQSRGELDSAAERYRQALALKPDFAEAHYNLGNIFHAQNKPDAAADQYREAIALKPDYAEAHYNLGNMLHAQNNLDAAAEHYRKAIAFKPDFAEAHYNLGTVFLAHRKMKTAIGCYQRALILKPDYAEAHNNLGVALQDRGKLDEAIASFHRALALKPDFAEAHNSLGGALMDQGKLDEAVASYRRALAHQPDYAEAYSNLLFLHAYHASLDARAYLALAQGWEQACVPAQELSHDRDRTFVRLPLAGRRLRLGYVSGDFRQHAVSYFIEQLFGQHDRARVELFAYSANDIRDAVTERLQSMADHWIPVKGMPDSAVLERIGSDAIDVLVDLSGHTANNRMGVFARRAAPVQMHYLGYFASTGLTQMDYFIGDEILTPPEMDDHFSERVWRLPRTWVSYKTIADAPEPDWHPAEDGSVWVGSFNNIGKFTPQTINLWARVLHELPEARLLLKTKGLADAGNRQRILDAMAGLGISADRIELQRNSDWADYMVQYNRLDIALDPIGGHGGGTTSCDALWMGVPVIHALGSLTTSRFTASMLNAIGHPEWIAGSEAEYVDKTVALARNVGLRKELRLIQRKQMAASPLCDAKDLAMNLEDAYAEMFERWRQRQAASTIV